MPDSNAESLLGEAVSRSACDDVKKVPATLISLVLGVGFAALLFPDGGRQHLDDQEMPSVSLVQYTQLAGAHQFAQLPIIQPPMVSQQRRFNAALQSPSVQNGDHSTRAWQFTRRIAAAASDDNTVKGVEVATAAPSANVAVVSDSGEAAPESAGDSGEKKKKVLKASSTDEIASFFTRRFGFKGGLAWLGFLTFGVVSEQAKTRWENRQAIVNTVDVVGAPETTLPSGVVYTELRRGGGEACQPGYLIGANVVLKVGGQAVIRGKEFAFIYGQRKGIITKGVEDGISDMRQGGKRILVIPPELAFGDKGAKLPDGTVPPGATVTYEIELTRVSVPPS